MNQKEQNRRRRIHLLFIAAAFTLCISLMGAVCVENAFAAGEKVYFGSEEYEWELYTSNPIGIYASADNNLEEVKYTIEYDPDMLDYDSDSGEFVSERRIQFESTNLGEDTYQLLLAFTPRVAGRTSIVIRTATVTEEGGDSVDLDETSVTITIPIPSGCHLDGISVNGTELSNFDPDTVYYTYRLDEYAEEVEISAEPDVGVEISDTHLEEGNNVIIILVENSYGQQARYRVNVINPENPERLAAEEAAAAEAAAAEEAAAAKAAAEEEAEAEQVIEAEEEIYEEEVAAVEVENETFLRRLSRLSSNFRVFTRNYSVLFIVLIVVIIVALFWWIVFIRNRRRHRKRTQKWKEERESKNEDINLEQTIQAAIETEDKPIEIVVSGITMDFKVEHDEPTSFKETVIRTLKRDRHVEMFRALDNISFAVGEGDVVGIIGTNGSGKSTLLKIISGALIPTKGRVTVNRDKVQLLTLGTGFDNELTGRENVYLNGAIIGYTKEYIDEKYDDIVKFAEIEDFMDEKVRNYSSGMVSRLGFAIATIRDTPEILILDEVLSVGDIFFRKKSEARIQEMIHGGSTVLIVSHSMGVIRKNCNKAIWIEKGKLRMMGDPDEVCKAYENMENSEAVE